VRTAGAQAQSYGSKCGAENHCLDHFLFLFVDKLAPSQRAFAAEVPLNSVI
jgi:hypothetical protein